MKKILTLSLIVLMALALTGCKKEETIVGGYTEAKDKTLTPELLEIFEKATKDIEGAKYEPIELIATQVVAGTNYKFLCDVTAVVPNAKPSKKIVIVYKDLQGNCSVLDVEDYK